MCGAYLGAWRLRPREPLPGPHGPRTTRYRAYAKRASTGPFDPYTTGQIQASTSARETHGASIVHKNPPVRIAVRLTVRPELGPARLVSRVCLRRPGDAWPGAVRVPEIPRTGPRDALSVDVDLHTLTVFLREPHSFAPYWAAFGTRRLATMLPQRSWRPGRPAT